MRVNPGGVDRARWRPSSGGLRATARRAASTRDAYRRNEMKALGVCHAELLDIYGYSVQVGAALGHWHTHLQEVVRGNNPTTQYHKLLFGRGDPNRPDAAYQYERTFGSLIAASAKEGITSVIHKRSVVTLLYSAWEDRHRQRIATEVGLESKNNIKSDVFRDLMLYRRAIVHASSKLRDEPKVLRFFGKNEIICLTDEHLDMAFREVVNELNRIGTTYYGCDPCLSFDYPLNR